MTDEQKQKYKETRKDYKMTDEQKQEHKESKKLNKK